MDRLHVYGVYSGVLCMWDIYVVDEYVVSVVPNIADEVTREMFFCKARVSLP